MEVAAILPELNMDLRGAVIREAVLQRSQNRLILRIANAGDLAGPERGALLRALSEHLGGMHVLVEFDEAAGSAASAAAQRPQTAAPTAPDGPAGPSAAIAATPAAKKEPDVLYGARIRDKARTPIAELQEGGSPVTVQGCFLSGELREGWGKGRDGQRSYRVQLNLTDNTDSIYCTASFFDRSKADRFFESVAPLFGGEQQVAVRGVCKMPRFAKELTFYINDINLAEATLRQDTAAEKRVELHLHSRMSTMDGLTDVTRAFKTAKRFGHKALAITDHGVVQAFPEAAKAAKKTGVKALFGVEGYLLPDT